jgi:hypothetical protein
MNDERRRELSDLDDLVVNMELTLISIVQGVALTFLVESSRPLVGGGPPEYWPYVASGLLTILTWWSRAAIHTFTVIGWPINFSHNFLYVASALVEAVMFTYVTDPPRWFAISAVFTAMVWVMFALDARLIRQARARTAGDAGAPLFAILQRDQAANVRYRMPATIAFYVIAAIATAAWPSWFIARRGHLAFAALQLAGGVANLLFIARFFRSISGSIPAARAR